MATKPLPPKFECMQILTRLTYKNCDPRLSSGFTQPRNTNRGWKLQNSSSEGDFHINNLQNALQMQNHSNSHKFKGIVTSMVCQDTRSYATQWNTCKSKAIHFESQELWHYAMCRLPIFCYLMERIQIQSNSLWNRRNMAVCYVQMLNHLLPNRTNANTEKFS